MKSRFDLLTTPIVDLLVLQRMPLGDSRGFLERLFCASELDAQLGGRRIVQINRTFTARRGTVRGLHFQRPPHEETKFVSCLRGEVFDVAVDLRPGSATFLHWHSEILSSENHKTLLIPEGFAHGFQTLSDDCEMLYFHTAAHNAQAEDGLNASDPRLAIRWPLFLDGLSPRDSAFPMLDDNFSGVVL